MRPRKREQQREAKRKALQILSVQHDATSMPLCRQLSCTQWHDGVQSGGFATKTATLQNVTCETCLPLGWELLLPALCWSQHPAYPQLVSSEPGTSCHNLAAAAVSTSASLGLPDTGRVASLHAQGMHCMKTGCGKCMCEHVCVLPCVHVRSRRPEQLCVMVHATQDVTAAQE